MNPKKQIEFQISRAEGYSGKDRVADWDQGRQNKFTMNDQRANRYNDGRIDGQGHLYRQCRSKINY